MIPCGPAPTSRGLLALLGLAVVGLFSGCVTQTLAKRIVAAPNHYGVTWPITDAKSREAADTLYTQTWQVAVLSPPAEISVGVIDPGMYAIKYDFTVKPGAKESKRLGSFSFEWSPLAPSDQPRPAPKGTVVLLHGITLNKESMLPWAMFFADKGYRVVLVDLRGHGRSTGDWIGYGAWEAADLTEVANDLDRRGLLVGKVGVFGVSYGAVMALHWAARDPRVGAVVALAPFSDPEKAVLSFAKGVRPRTTALLGEARFIEAEKRAATLAGFNWNDASVLQSVAALKVPVFFFHGRGDFWIPPENSRILYRSAPKGSRLVLSNDNHMSLPLRFDNVAPRVLTWFEEKLVAEPSLTVAK